MSHIAGDTDGNCRIGDDEVLEQGSAAADALIEQEMSSDKEEHMGEIRQIMLDKQSGQAGDAVMSRTK